MLIVLCLSSWLVTKGQDVLLINGLHTPFLDYFFHGITSVGEGFIFVPLFAIVLFIRFQYAMACVITVVTQALLISAFKRWLLPDMLRPIGVLDNDLLYFVPGVDVHALHSFPSGHTTTAFGVAVFIILLTRNPTLGVVSLIVALLVACSRIYLLQHFLIDVTAGALIGASSSFLVWHLLEIHPREWMKRRIRFTRHQQRASAPGV